jgi:DNA-binding XRE family transcriptional regulator
MQTGVTHPLQGSYSRRKMLNVTAKDIATALGMQPQSFYRLEKGERVCPLPKAITLARLLQCTVEQLGQEPSIEEQVAAVRARHDAEAQHEIATIAPSTPAPEPAPVDLGIPIHDQYGRVVGYQHPPTATINTADNSVVNAPPVPAQQPADPVLVELLRTMPTGGTMTEDDD